MATTGLPERRGERDRRSFANAGRSAPISAQYHKPAAGFPIRPCSARGPDSR